LDTEGKTESFSRPALKTESMIGNTSCTTLLGRMHSGMNSRAHSLFPQDST
jgi:hypothetical protein